MPRGLLVVIALNVMLGLVFGGNLYVFYADGVTRTYTFVASWVALAGLTLTLAATAFRSRLWHRLARAGLYAVALVFGVHIMALIPRLAEPGIAWSTVGMAVVVVYTVGARGYLNSSPARAYFGLETDPPS